VGGGLFFIYALFLAGMRFPRPGTSSEGEEESEHERPLAKSSKASLEQAVRLFPKTLTSILISVY